MNDFDSCFERLIGHEGGFQKDPADRGNWTSGKIGVGELKGTKYGISAMSYPHEDIENLTLDRAKAIYLVDFWTKAGCAAVDGPMRFDLFDTAVNSGVEQAVKFVQRSVGTVDDGKLGPKTLMAMAGMNPYQLLARFNGHRLDFMNNLPTWPRYGTGWSQRIAENLMEA